MDIIMQLIGEPQPHIITGSSPPRSRVFYHPKSHPIVFLFPKKKYLANQTQIWVFPKIGIPPNHTF